MFANELIPYFAEIGARLTVTGVLPPRNRRIFGVDAVVVRSRPFTLNIDHDKHGEHFTLDVTTEAPDFRILQARRDERHLLLYAHNADKERFLCGHDERHWFVASVAEPVSTVMAARRALLPKELRNKGLNKTTLTTRHNDVFVRQGEWFFVPVRDAKLLAAIAELPIHSYEPIQRGTRSKAHRCEKLVRVGGTAVVLYKGVEHSQAEWNAMQKEPGFRAIGRVEQRMKDMSVYVTGKICHPDHATITLDGWHSVYLNGELVSSNVTFYD